MSIESASSNSGILFTNLIFAKNPNCVDFLSFDPGYVNAGVCHLRVDKIARKFCVVHAALIDVLKPNDCFTRAQQKTKRARFTERVQPFCQLYPSSDEIDYYFALDDTYRQRVAAVVAKKANSDHDSVDDVLFAEYVALLPFTLQSVSWLNGTEPIDQVLLEIQDHINTKMRCVAHAIQSFYETKNATTVKQVPVEFVSARLKLSTAVLSTLADQLLFENGKPMSEQSLVALVDATSHATRKQSAVRIFDALSSAAPMQHLFFKWYATQRATKHNIIDSILQCLSYCLEKDIGFEPGILNGKRKQAASQRAKELRLLKKQQQLQVRNIDEPAMLDLTANEINPLIENVSDTSVKGKRRKVVAIDL